MNKIEKTGIISFIFLGIYFMFCKFTKASLSSIALIFVNNNILSNSDMAYLASAYYFVGAVMCIPAGIIISKIGFKKSYIISASFLAL